MASFGDLSLALAQAITYLTRSLIARYSATTIIKLQLALESNMRAHFEASWLPSDPLHGSGRRCLTLSPTCAPPRPIYRACKTAGVEWTVWASLLGGVEFDLFVNPGCVSVRFSSWGIGHVGKTFIIWTQDAIEAEPDVVACKSFAEELSIHDADDDEELFSILAEEIREPTWVTPIASSFPSIVIVPPRSDSISPISDISSHSRSSSSSGFTFSSCSSTDSLVFQDATSQFSTHCTAETPLFKLSRRERAQQARVFVDSSKTTVTNYDGGKTAVLTGGVMLGAARTTKLSSVAASAALRKASPSGKSSVSSDNWRVTRT